MDEASAYGVSQNVDMQIPVFITDESQNLTIFRSKNRPGAKI